MPKSHYLPEDTDIESGIDSLSVSSESLYQTVGIAKDNYHEVREDQPNSLCSNHMQLIRFTVVNCTDSCTNHQVPVVIHDPGSVITWDFDICKNDCIFTILYTTSTSKLRSTTPPASPALQASISELHPELRLTQVLQPIYCSDGSSEQVNIA